MRFACAAVILLSSTTAAAADRSGFTAEVGAGLGYGLFVPSSKSDFQSEADFALSPLSISAGAFVSPNVAIFARTTSIARQPRSRWEISSIYGAGAQVWVSESVFLAGAIGYAAIGRGVVSALFNKYQSGFGGELRLGYAFMRVPGHAFAIHGAWTPAFYSETSDYIPFALHGVTIAAEWQYGG